jgi:hypothetical protein
MRIALHCACLLTARQVFQIRCFDRPDEAPGAKRKSANIAQRSRPRAIRRFAFHALTDGGDSAASSSAGFVRILANRRSRFSLALAFAAVAILLEISAIICRENSLSGFNSAWRRASAPTIILRRVSSFLTCAEAFASSVFSFASICRCFSANFARRSIKLVLAMSPSPLKGLDDSAIPGMVHQFFFWRQEAEEPSEAV